MSGKMSASESWFKTKAPIWHAMFDDIKPTRYLEIGSFEGDSACFAINDIGARNDGEVVCVDPWENYTVPTMSMDGTDMEKTFGLFGTNTAAAVDAAEHDVHVRVMREKSSTALIKLLAEGQAGTFDVVFVDGAHDAASVLYDAVLGFELLRVGGTIILDDYLWSGVKQKIYNPIDAPKIAIDAFTTVYFKHLGYWLTPISTAQVSLIKQ